VPELRFGRRGFALGIEELPDDDPLIEAMKRLTEEDGKNDN
jgi:hypothetical protein